MSPSPIRDSAASRTVFISSSSLDRVIVGRLADALYENGITTFLAERDILPGQEWAREISEQIANTACVVVLVSANFASSNMAAREIERAISYGKTVIPVRIENVELSGGIEYTLGSFHWLDLMDWRGDPSDVRFLRLVKAIEISLRAAPSSPREARVQKESQRALERRSQVLFRRNLRVESAIEHFDLANTAFYRSLSWNLNPGINILLGRNGYGKTYLLRSLLALLQNHDDAALNTLGDGSGSVSLLQAGEERLIHFSDHYFDEETAVGKLPVLAIPDTRFVNRAVTTLSAISDETTGGEDRADLGSYGAWHFLEERPYESMLQSFLYGICLDYFERELRFEGEQFDLIRGVVRELTDQSFEFDRVAREGRDRFTLYVRTEGNEETPLPIQKASQGTLSVIAMFGLIYEFLGALQQEMPEVCSRRGIVIIDEVDAHLHPLWQQKVVSLLRNRFPRVQFVITAHNPIVVAGCLEDEVSVLRKSPDGGFSLYQFPNDFVGWHTEEIYRKVFGIENPDESFARFDAMRPFKAQLEKQAADLASQPERNPEDDLSLDEIEGKIRYIERAEEVRSRRLSQEELERENRILQEQVLGLESARQSAAKMQLRLDRFTQGFESIELAFSIISRRTNMIARFAIVFGLSVLGCFVLLFVLPGVRTASIQLGLMCLCGGFFVWLAKTSLDTERVLEKARHQTDIEAASPSADETTIGRS